MTSTIKALPWATYQRIPAQNPGFEVQEERSCPLTGETEAAVIVNMPDFQLFTDDGGKNRMNHQVVINEVSGLIYANPCFTEDGFRYLFEKAGASYCHPGQAELNQQRLTWLNEWYPEAGSYLDVACGTGDFLGLLPEGKDRCGVDIDPMLIERAARKYKDISFFVGDIETLSFQADVITLFHALEHFPDPLNTLQQFRAIAKDNTRLMIEVPVLDFAVGSALEKTLVGFFTPQHLTHFSKASLRAMLRHSGWEIEKEADWKGNVSYVVLAKPGKSVEIGLSELERLNDKHMAKAYLENQIQHLMGIWDKSLCHILPGDLPIVLWGAGMHTEYLFRCYRPLFKDRALLIVDKDPLKQGGTFHSIPVISPDDIPAEVWQAAPFWIIPSSYHAQGQILAELQSRCVPPRAITLLYGG